MAMVMMISIMIAEALANRCEQKGIEAKEYVYI